MTDLELQRYYDKLQSYYQSGELRSLQNEDRSHNATILCFIMNTAKEVNMYCGEMSIFRKNFYSYVDDIGFALKNDVVDALNMFIERPDVKLNIIVENYSDNFLADVISQEAFSRGIDSKKIFIRKLNKNSVVTEGLTHCVYTDTRCVRIEYDIKQHSAMFLTNVSDELLEKFESNYRYLIRSSEPVNLSMQF